MPSSRRERRLWGWTALAVGGIYSTLGLSSILAELRYSQTAAAVAFLTAMFLIGVAVLTQGLRIRPRGVEVGVGLGIGVIYSMVLFRMTIPERSHLVEYGVVAILIYEALSERAGSGRRVPVVWLSAIAATTAIGILDETIQIAVPNRVFDPLDMVFNAGAAVMAVVAMVGLRWVRALASRRSSTSGRT